MCAHWYPEGYVLPNSPEFPPGPHHPAYTQKLPSRKSSAGPVPWYPSHANPLQRNRTRSIPSLESSAFNAESLARMAGVTDPGLISGIDYFKIGDIVRVRRFTPNDTYTDWAYGSVMRPHLLQYRKGEPERVYYVSYLDPRNGKRKEKEFSTVRKEIAPLLDRRSTPLVVFALLPSISSQQPVQLWTPAHVIGRMSDGSVQVRVATGSELGSDFYTKSIVPYNSSVAHSLIKAGQRVEGNGHNVY